MKKVLIILFATMVLINMAACTAESPVTASKKPTDAPASPAPTVAETITPTESPIETVAATEPNTSAGKDYSQLGMELMKTETIGTLKLGLKESELLAVIGKAESETAPEVWGADGKKHCNWNYPAKGLTVSMVESGNAESEFIVYAIAAEAPSDLATAKGIKIGSSKDDVLLAYGDVVEDQSDEAISESIVAGTVFGGVIFGMKDGVVNSVFLGAAAE